jgi:hypothetical protein
VTPSVTASDFRFSIFRVAIGGVERPSPSIGYCVDRRRLCPFQQRWPLAAALGLKAMAHVGRRIAVPSPCLTKQAATTSVHYCPRIALLPA